MPQGYQWFKHLPLLVLLFITSCATLPQHPPNETLLAYRVTEEAGLLHKHSPVFIIEEPESTFNRISTPRAQRNDVDQDQIVMDVNHPQIFSETRYWETEKESYTNLIYRIHFQEIPFSLIPFNLGAGKNVGLLFIVTLDEQENPLLYTTLHTCGCYLSFTPTSFLPEERFPDEWQKSYQYIYSEYLPGFLDFTTIPGDTVKIHILLRKTKHRVKDIWLSQIVDSFNYPNTTATLRPMEDLEKLPLSTGGSVSFFESQGPRKHYVKNSQKIWERILISWWALDWRVGEDKKFGRNKNEGTTFYTSLKPWAREESDLRDFASFLKYWGWNF